MARLALALDDPEDSEVIVAHWQEELRELAAAIGSHVRRGANALERLVDQDPYQIVGYRGFGDNGRVLLLGRVLEHDGLAIPDPGHSKLRNLFAMLKRLESDPLPFARVKAQLPNGHRELVADDEGFIREWLEVPVAVPGWSAVRSSLSMLGPAFTSRRCPIWYRRRPRSTVSSAIWMTR
jgi:hypothetical protein